MVARTRRHTDLLDVVVTAEAAIAEARRCTDCFAVTEAYLAACARPLPRRLCAAGLRM